MLSLRLSPSLSVVFLAFLPTNKEYKKIADLLPEL
jgi:hypothetical protein